MPGEGGLDAPISYEGTIDYIIHTASPTGSRYFVEHPVETIHTAIDGTDHVLRLAREHQVEGMVYLSSLEVYGTPRGEQTKGTIKEDDAACAVPIRKASVWWSVSARPMRLNMACRCV